MSIAHNKYTVAQRLLAVESELGDLRKLVQSIELKEGRTGNPGATGASGKDGVQGIPGRDGKDAAGIQGSAGKDGRSIQGQKGDRGEASQVPGPAGPAGRDGKDSTVPGPQGIPGSVTYIGPAEVEAAVKEVRAELLRLRAAFVGRIVQSIADNKGDNGTQRHFRNHLASILKDIETL